MAGVADGEFLKRSGSTIVSAAAGTSSWTTAYSVDFTTLGSQNLITGGDGTKTIDSKSWTLTNSANLASANVTNGTGIVLVCNANNGNYGSGSVRTAGLLTIPFSSLITNYSIENHIVRIRARIILTNASTSFEGTGVLIEPATSQTTQAIGQWKIYSGASPLLRTHEMLNGTLANAITDAVNVSHDAYTLILEAPDKYEAYSGLYSGGFPASPTFQWSARLNVGSTPVWVTQSNPCVTLIVTTANTSNHGTTATITHLQVDTFAKHPAA
jgi:hypothetical protein